MKKLLVIFVILTLLFLIRNTFFSIVEVLNNGDAAGTLKKELEGEKKKNEFLTQRLFYVKTNGFVEEEARRKLGLVKQGEHTVIAPSAPTKEEKTVEIDTRPNWEKWWSLFF